MPDQDNIKSWIIKAVIGAAVTFLGGERTWHFANQYVDTLMAAKYKEGRFDATLENNAAMQQLKDKYNEVRTEYMLYRASVESEE